MTSHKQTPFPPAARRSGQSLSIWMSGLAVSLALSGCATQTASSGNGLGPAPTGAVGPNTLNVADAAIAGGDPQMALSVSQSVLASDPGNVDALVHEGDAYYALNRCPPAEAAYQLALKSDAKSSAAETGLGRCLLKVDPVSAETAFLAATQDDPGNADALNDLGIARDLQGNFAGAVVPYQQALLANPALTAAEVNLGLSLALSGQGPEALQYLGPLATGPNATPKMREDYAAALVATGRNDEAREVLAVDLPPDQVDQAMAGFQALISNAITNPPPPPPPAPTVAVVPAPPVEVTPEMPVATAPTPLMPAASAPAPAPAAAPVPAPAAPPPAPAPTRASVPAPAPAAAPAPPPAAVPAAPAAAHPAPDPAPVHAPAMAAAPAAPPKPVAQAIPSATQIAAMQPRPAPAPALAPAMVPVPGHEVAVQLAALNTPADAHAEWQKAYNEAPSLFVGKAPQISKVAVKDKTFYRLRVGGFSGTVEAAKFCAELSAAGGTCTLANF